MIRRLARKLVPVRVLRSDIEQSQYAGENADIDFSDITEDDLSHYFDKGAYNKDLARSNVNRKLLQSVYDKYMAEDYGEPGEIAALLDKAGVIMDLS